MSETHCLGTMTHGCVRRGGIANRAVAVRRIPGKATRATCTAHNHNLCEHCVAPVWLLCGSSVAPAWRACGFDMDIYIYIYIRYGC